MPLDPEQLLKPLKKFGKLTRSVRRDPLPETVHVLRTTARRIEATLCALHLDEQEPGKALLKDMEVVRKLAGKVRDCDVLTQYTAGLHPSEDEQDCLVRLLGTLGAERHGYAKQLHRGMRDQGRALRKELKATRKELAGLLSGDEGNGNPAEAAAAKALELAGQLSAPQRLAAGTLHAYRLTVKKLENTLRLGADQSHAGLAEELGQVKDAIGEWHDWEALVSVATEVLDHERCQLLATLQRTEQSKRKHALAAATRLRTGTLRKPARGQRASRKPSRPVLTAVSMLAG